MKLNTSCWWTKQSPRTTEIGAQTWQWHGLTTGRHMTQYHNLRYLKVWSCIISTHSLSPISNNPWLIGGQQSVNITDVAIKCGIYHGGALSPLLFCVALNPLCALLDYSKYGYPFKNGTTINHFLYMDDIKLYAKSERDIDLLIHPPRVFSNDIGMSFSLRKCGHLIVRRAHRWGCNAWWPHRWHVW